ncbi:hypothetical protein PP613_21980 [Mycobacteroides abscessus]|nr:hypothetical protein [Mycobacteroides abscessus]MDM2412042.1 hypothetical protein [Mycobacteroides abscessus]
MTKTKSSQSLTLDPEHRHSRGELQLTKDEDYLYAMELVGFGVKIGISKNPIEGLGHAPQGSRGSWSQRRADICLAAPAHRSPFQ